VWIKFPCAELHGRKPLGSCWDFKKKKESDLSICYKGYIVVKGYVQILGIDFTGLFTPFMTDTRIQIVFAITMHYKMWTLEIIGAEASFLEGNLEEEIYLEWPEGVIDFGFNGEMLFLNIASNLIKLCMDLSKQQDSGTRIWYNV
jgi:Reverse transcriptase (RNA-dependent DNA polymerase)